MRARTCVLSRRARVYPARPCNTVRHHFNEDVITDVSALESAMRPWRDTPSRIIGCLINHCAMHASLPLALTFVLHEARCIPAAHRARSFRFHPSEISASNIMCSVPRERGKGECFRDENVNAAIQQHILQVYAPKIYAIKLTEKEGRGGCIGR